MGELAYHKVEGIVKIGHGLSRIQANRQLRALVRKETLTGCRSAMLIGPAHDLPVRAGEGIARPRRTQRDHLGHGNRRRRRDVPNLQTRSKEIFQSLCRPRCQGRRE